MAPSIAVMPREGSLALAFFGRTRKVRESAFAPSAGRKSFALKRIVVLVICFVSLIDAEQATVGSRTASASKRRQRTIDSRQHFFFSENFQQMIQARPHIAASNREASGMNNRPDFDSEL